MRVAFQRLSAKGLIVLAALAAAPAAAASLVTRSYDIHGARYEDLISAMGRSGPIGSAGRTELAASLRFSFARGPAGYVLTHIEVSDRITQTLPRWLGKAKAAPCLRAQWDATLAALRRHEDTHKRKYLDYRPTLLAALKALPPQPDGAALSAQVKAINARVLGEIEDWQSGYDARTNFGVAEGVVLRAC